jgi:small-conductance mechanosensitive channel
MLILTFPLLPGSDSNIFRGVSVFIGILFSLGSSSAIANMVAGLVITYMRPFQMGDKIKTGDVTGVVIEKTLLVTRLRTILNEEITIPNSAILSGNTTNYSTFSETGVIVHVSVGIGYDVSWKTVHDSLLEAASKVEFVLKTPPPFVLQTSLDDFYASYMLCVYVADPNKEGVVISFAKSANSRCIGC